MRINGSRILFFLLVLTLSAEPDLRSLIRSVETQYLAGTSEALCKMLIQRSGWSRTLRMNFYGQGRDHFLARVLEPLREKGVSTLKIESEMWNYLPGIDRVIKLPSSLMGDSWMGSHLTNDDLIKADKVDLLYTLSLEVQSPTTYIILAYPKPDSAVVWGKIRYHIDRLKTVAQKIEYFDEDQSLVRVMLLEDVRLIDGRLVPMKLLIQPLDKPQESTILYYESLKLDQKIPQGLFAVAALRRKG